MKTILHNKTICIVISLAMSFIWAQGQTAQGVGYGQTKDARSEERRVGKECRSRWSPYH